jgi:hypothetical protein
MIKKTSGIFVIILLCAFCLTEARAYAAQSVSVTIPSFQVYLNDNYVGNGESEPYPFLLYKDITYFPMTYYRCRLLNLISDWTKEEGLVISTGDPFEWKQLGLDADFLDQPNNRKQTAAIVTDSVTVNGKAIDNAVEEYPLLLFRGITYFPLTWRFAVDEFGWNYSFGAEEGLSVRADNAFYQPNEYHSNGYSAYLRDGLHIRLYGYNPNLTGLNFPMQPNLFIVIDGSSLWRTNQKPVGEFDKDYFGLPDYRFTVEGDWIHTTHSADFNSKEYVPCRVNIRTGEIVTGK